MLVQLHKRPPVLLDPVPGKCLEGYKAVPSSEEKQRIIEEFLEQQPLDFGQGLKLVWGVVSEPSQVQAFSQAPDLITASIPDSLPFGVGALPFYC